MPGIGFLQDTFVSVAVHFGATRASLMIMATQDMLSRFAKQLGEEDRNPFVEIHSVQGHIYLIRRAAITRMFTSLQSSSNDLAHIQQPPISAQVLLHFADGTNTSFTADSPITVVQYLVDLAAARTPDSFCAITGPGGRLLTLPVRELDVMVASKASIDAAIASQGGSASSDPVRQFLAPFAQFRERASAHDVDPPLPGERHPSRPKPPRKLS